MAKRNKTINTEGGASIGKNVQTDGGGFVGRDQINFFVSLGDWKKLLEFLSKSNAGDATHRQWQTFDWSKAEQAYLDKVLKLYDRVRILGNSEDVPLGKLFTQVYILDKPTAFYYYDIEEMRGRGHDRLDFQRQPGERRHGLDLVKNNKNLFILGKPGAGKTTFLKYITIQAATKQLPRIPIFVSLNQWADSKWGKGDKATLLPFLVDQFDICDFPDAELFIDYLLKEGRALVLFDGLDEVKQERDQRQRLTRLLQDFANKYDKSQHLITCRIAASDYAFSGFTDVEVANFTPDQVYEYTCHWFGEQDKKFEAFTTELANPENKGLAELCNTPLLLSLLCLTFDNNMRFPPSRAELYEDALETLLRKWDSSRAIQRDEIYRALSHKRKLQLLMSIAVPTFEKGELFFRQRDLEKWIVDYLSKLPGAPPADILDGTAILKAIEAQHSILVERAQGIYSFSHLTFQEYLIARYVAENRGREVTDKLIRTHLTDQRWREVFVLIASLLDDADDFVTAMRATTDELLIDTPSVLHLLASAHERRQQVDVPVERRYAVRLTYIFLSLSLSLARSISLTLSLTFARARTRVFAHAQILNQALARAPALARAIMLDLDVVLDTNLAIELDHDLDPNRVRSPYRNQAQDLGPNGESELDSDMDQDLEFDCDIEQETEFDFDLDYKTKLEHELYQARDLDLSGIRSLALATTPLVGFDYGLYYTWAYATLFASKPLDRMSTVWQAAMQPFPNLVKGLAELAGEAGLMELAQQLVTQPIPLPSASGQAWLEYADALFAILHDECYLGSELDLNERDGNKLNDYFYANELLVQCLKVAVVSNRQTILNSLLLPPNFE